jgi:amino acid adenylation domain-containing protein/non-ribosomal peptide synthase protein (TIGR01720 family)
MSDATHARYASVSWDRPWDESDLVQICGWRATEQRDDVAYTFLADGETDERNLTYGELDARARAIAVALRRRAAPGDRALLLYEPGLDYIAAFFGCLYADIVAVPVYPPDPLRVDRTLPRLQSIMADAAATVLMCTGQGASLVSLLLGDGQTGAAVLPTDDLPDDWAAQWRRPAVDAERLAYLQYTSGSTGSPKGVMVSHRNLLYNVSCFDRAGSAGVTGVTWLPTYHDFGLIGAVVLPMYSGRRTISMSPLAFVQRPLRWLEAITRYRGTFTGAPNFSFDLCVRKSRPEERAGLDLSSLSVVLNGAEPVRQETMDRFIEAFAPHGFSREAFVACYGLAEATLGVTGGAWPAYPRVKSFCPAALERHRAKPADAAGSRALVSCGGPIPQTEVAIVDPETCVGRPAGAVGEIWVRGPGVARGYWNRPEATQGTFRGVIVGRNGGPYLRTGDLGFLDDGELYVTGRWKDLVIVRGRNHYPQDIELTVQRAHRALKQDAGAAFAVEHEDDERLVVVQEVLRAGKLDTAEVLASIREAVLLGHEIPVYAIVLIQPGTIAKTSSGKIQRNACRQAYHDGRLSVVCEWRAETDAASNGSRGRKIIRPRTRTEAQLAELYGEVLGLEEVGVHDNFFDLGGQSLLATQLVARIRSVLRVDLPLRVLFAAPTVAELAREVEALATGAALDDADRIGPAPPGSAPVLSSGQQRLWFVEHLASGVPLLNLCVAVRIRRELNAAALREALAAIGRRHEALRTTFATDDTGRPILRIAAAQPLDFCEIDLAVLPDAVREAELAKVSAEEAARPFDLASGPLWRTTLARCGARDHTLLISMHHLVSDGWSFSVLLRELMLEYEAKLAGRASPVAAPELQYRDYAAWQQRRLGDGELQPQLDYWRGQLADAPACLELPIDRPRPAAPTFRGAVRTWHWPPVLSRALEDFSRRAGATTYMTLLAALQAVLARYSGQTDICVGTAVAGRPRRELEGLIGFFVNALVMRGDLSGNPSFRQLVDRTRETALAAYEHAELPFERVVEALAPQRDRRQVPLFQVALVVQNQPWQAPTDEVTLTEVPNGTSQHDLTFTLWQEGSRLAGALQYSTGLFDAATIDRLLESFRILLQGALADPTRPIEELPVLDAAQQQQVLVAWNDTQAPFADGSCLHELFEEQARQHPQRAAIAGDVGELSYEELNRRANRLARHLHSLGVGAETLVGVALPRSADAIIAVLAVLKAGGAYVPLDPEYPPARLAAMLGDARPPVVVTDARTLAALPALDARAVVVDRDAAAIAAEDDANLSRTAGAGNLAYVIYTSGSSGAPKGVLIEHRSACHMIAWYRACLGVVAESRALQFASLSFDAAAGEIFSALCNGATLVLPSAHRLVPDAEFIEFLERQRVEVALLPPSFLALLPPAELPHLQTLTVAGEACPARLVERWAPGRRMLNGYGPTEATVGATWAACETSDDRPPAIGRPFPNVRIYLLDCHRQPVPLGAPGEIHIGGPGVARGYLNRPELTAERFPVDPFAADGGRMYRTGDLARYRSDGQLEYLGRRDEQVKVRGFRIELAEIEAALARQPGVVEAAVVVRDRGGSQCLAAYVTGDGAALSPVRLRTGLAADLPDFMVPAHFTILAELPRTPNGKLDRHALPEPVESRPDLATGYVAPRTAAEATLARIWSETIGVQRVGVHDNFFELGGDSLTSMQVAARATAAGLGLTPRQAFACQTVAEQAAAAGRERPILAAQDAVVGEAPLTPIQRWFFDNEPFDPHHFNQAVMFEVAQRLDADCLRAAVAELLVQHDALRLRLDATPGGWRQIHVPPGDEPPLEVIDLSHLEEPQQPPAIEAHANRLQQGLDLTRGPLLRVALFDRGAGRSCRLLLVIHHLAIDAVSWRILLEDLQRTYEQLVRGQRPMLPPKSTSYRDWSLKLTELAQSPAQREEAAWWIAALADAPARLPRDAVPHATNGHAHAPQNTVASTGEVTAALSAEETEALLHEAPRAWQARIDELLLAALARAVSGWTGDDAVLVEVEGHGREDLFDDVDLSRTVGWFTSAYPVVLPAGGPDLQAALAGVQQRVRGVPRRGIGFGLLRYLSTDRVLVDQLAALPRPEISFNYLGAVAPLLGGGLRLALESVGPSRSPRQVRRHAIELNGLVRDGRVQFAWTYSRDLHCAATIERVAGAFLEELRSLIAASRAAAPKAAPSKPTDALTHELMELCQEELPALTIAASSNHTFQSGTPSEAQRLQARVAARYGVELPMGDLAQARSIEQLAAAVRRCAVRGPRSPLIAIQAGGTRRPLFLVHPAGGHVFPYYGLARRLGPDQPVYGLEARGLDGVWPAHRSVEALSEEYLAAVRDVQPAGPYRLGGWSFGGLVAYEMARRLEEEGEQIEFLGLLDTRVVANGHADEEAAFAALAAMFPGADRRSLAELSDMDPETRLSHFVRHIESVHLVMPGVERAQARRMLEVFEANSQAWLSYRPPQSRVEVRLFRAADATSEHAPPLDLGWSGAAGDRLRIESVPGDHLSMVREPHVRTLAARLAAALRTDN